MYNNSYVPNVLVAGDVEEFRAKIGSNRAARIIGQVQFVGEVDGIEFDLLQDQKILLNGKIVNYNVLIGQAKQSKFDYIVFVDMIDFIRHSEFLSLFVLEGTRIINTEFFLQNVKGSFFSIKNAIILLNLLAANNLNSFLDVDSFFAEGEIYTKLDALESKEIDGICTRKFFPIFNNIYNKIYNSLEECKFRHYDALILTAERDVDELNALIQRTQEMTNMFIIFVRKGSKLVTAINKSNARKMEAVNGFWSFLSINKSNSLKIYVVAHKKFECLDLPKNYAVIQAGKAINEDLGFIGDNTGDNISNLNPYLNEATAMYWIWKNATENYIGLSHYHRFFTTDNSKKYLTENILSSEDIIKILQKNDIIISRALLDTGCTVYFRYFKHHPEGDTKVTNLALNLMRIMIERYQPTYIDAFEHVINGSSLFPFNMFITRKYIYDSYCAWLFPMIFEVRKELIKTVNLDELKGNHKRILGYICETSFTMWIIKNNLRIKELPIMIGK